MQLGCLESKWAELSVNRLDGVCNIELICAKPRAPFYANDQFPHPTRRMFFLGVAEVAEFMGVGTNGAHTQR